jgi:ATP-binding cassette subfamily G (WHITE) protein 2 (PDR)
MCQPKTISKKDKLAYVEKIIKLMGMEYYANAIIGVPGEGKTNLYPCNKFIS